jgi:glycosyltransferase involved in cell wall biosynthesis
MIRATRAGCEEFVMARKILLFANTDWYLFNFRLALAKQLKANSFDVFLLSPPGDYGIQLQQEGFRWQALPMDRRSLNPLSEFQLIRHLVQVYRREQPDVVHHFTIKCVVYGAIAAHLAKVPARINAVAGMGYVFTNPELRARLLQPVVRRLLRLALDNPYSRLILQNHDDMTAFRRAGLISADRVRLIKGSGVDTWRFRPSDTPVLTGPETRVVLASRLLWDKGIAEYVEAARRLRTAGLPIRFLLAGSSDWGNPAAISQAQLRAWQGEGVVELLGQVEDMSALFAQTDIAVLPSYREGLPKSLIEAAACGLPLVTTDVPGCREVVTDGENGLVVPVRDATALANAISRLHKNPELARKMGRVARERALTEFDERIVIAKTLLVYQELLPALALNTSINIVPGTVDG